MKKIVNSHPLKSFLNLKLPMKKLVIAISAVCLMGSCTQKPANTNSYVAIDKTQLDTTVKPGDDFFAYVNSKWIKNNPIPATEGSWGSFYILRDSSKAVLHRIGEKDAATKNAAKGSTTQMVGDFYATGMDTTAINAAGIKPTQPWIDSINNIKNTNDLIRVNAIAQI
jgi:putative endopeptidase